MRPCDNIRLGPKPPWDDPKWIEEGNRLAEAIIAAARKELDGSMHYRNGREAKNGDVIVQLGSSGEAAGQIQATGVLYGAQPGQDYCNGSIAPIQNPVTGACLCDCLHIDDLAALLKEKGLDKRPEGK